MKIVHNPEFCIGCRACQQACWDLQDFPEGYMLCSVKTVEQMESDPKVYHSFHTCHQCEQPECQKQCPVQAISKDERGIVIVDEEKCIGCRKCQKSCPYNAIIVVRGKARKCELCRNRKEAQCAASCIMECLSVK